MGYPAASPHASWDRQPPYCSELPSPSCHFLGHDQSRGWGLVTTSPAAPVLVGESSPRPPRNPQVPGSGQPLPRGSNCWSNPRVTPHPHPGAPAPVLLQPWQREEGSRKGHRPLRWPRQAARDWLPPSVHCPHFLCRAWGGQAASAAGAASPVRGRLWPERGLEVPAQGHAAPAAVVLPSHLIQCTRLC